MMRKERIGYFHAAKMSADSETHLRSGRRAEDISVPRGCLLTQKPTSEVEGVQRIFPCREDVC
jgi:hypothetical protein